MPKLTLSVDRGVVDRAKQYAKTQGTSVSRLVEKMLDMAASESHFRARSVSPSRSNVRVPPVLARLRGSLKAGSHRDYHRYLERKYR